MHIKHYFNQDKISVRDNESLGFLLTNTLGGYLALFSKPISRYYGWFFTHNNQMFKVINDIVLEGESHPIEIKNNFWNIERFYKTNTETFFLTDNSNVFIYELQKEAEIELSLDAKESYDNNEINRFYNIYTEKQCIIVECINNQHTFYLAIKTKKINFSKIGEWVLEEYDLDKQRNSNPYQRYVYKALKIKAKKIIFAVNFDKQKAIKEAEKAFINANKLITIKKNRINKLLLSSNKDIVKNNLETQFAYLSAINSLYGLFIIENKKNNIRLRAGLPWFFQCWARDELISSHVINTKHKKNIILHYFNNINSISDLDALGWLFFRAGEMMMDKDIRKLFFKHIDQFNILDASLTWMDTLSRRHGVELYALKLQMYKTAYKYSRDPQFAEKEKSLLTEARKIFWNGEILGDTPNNFIIRPNLFLVAYIYPDFLSKEEWTICFDNALSLLWLDWGGVSTIDKAHYLFEPSTTGENSKSYHNGDSWFWINNLVAIVLIRLRNKKFNKYIKKILTSSTKEILWKGFIGHHTEISSAEALKSEGCLAQLWSVALYIEAINTLNIE